MNVTRRHTQTPWSVANSDLIFGADGKLVANTETATRSTAQDLANAAFIVKAVNSHEGLTAALKTLYSAIDSCVDLTPEIMEQARAALAAAGEPV